jgi:hypothetical protein
MEYVEAPQRTDEYELPKEVLDWVFQLPPFKWWSKCAKDGLSEEAAEHMNALCKGCVFVFGHKETAEKLTFHACPNTQQCLFTFVMSISPNQKLLSSTHLHQPFENASSQLQNVMVAHGFLAFLHHVATSEKWTFRFTTVDRVVSSLRSICQQVLKSNSLLFLTHVFSVRAMQKCEHTPRIMTFYLNRVAESLECCTLFDLASIIYIDAYNMLRNHADEHQQACFLSLNAGVACRRAGNYQLAEWAYSQHARHAMLAREETNWETVKHLYMSWKFAEMAVYLHLIIDSNNCAALTARMRIVEHGGHLRDQVRGLVDELGLLDIYKAAGLPVRVSGQWGGVSGGVADVTKAVAQLSTTEPVLFWNHPKRGEGASPQPSHERQEELRRYRERENDLEKRKRDTDRARRARALLTRNTKIKDNELKVKTRDIELAGRTNNNAFRSTHPRPTKTAVDAAKTDAARAASMEACVEHEANLIEAELQRVGELEIRAEKVRIGNAIQRGD